MGEQQLKTKEEKPFFKKKKVRIILIIVFLLVVIRIILPSVILHYANKAMADMDGYTGHIKDIDLAIYRGAYKIKDIYLHKKDSVTNKETEFFDSRLIDLSIEWKALFNGRIVGELEFHYPTLRFTRGEAEPAQIVEDTTNFRKLLKDFMPLKVNRFEVWNGTIQYIDLGSQPPVNIKMDSAHILAENLTNIKEGVLLPSKVTATAHVYGGTLNFNMKLDPLAKDPVFDMNAELKNTELPRFNDFFKAYGNFDVNKGIFGLYTEIAAKDKKFTGYVKPLTTKLDIVGPEDREEKFLQKFWENIVGTAGTLFKNQERDQVATKIPLEGTLENTNANIWYAVMSILRNAFVKALEPSIDYEINIHSVEAEKIEEKKGFLEKVFNPKDKKEKQDK